MATFSSDKPAKEEDVQTEEADPAETITVLRSSKKKKPPKKKFEQRKMSREKKLARAFLISIQSILMQRSYQTMERGFTSFACDQSRRLAPQNHGSTTFSSGSLETQSPFQQQQQRLTTAHNQSLGTLFPTMVTTQQPGWSIRDHSSASAWSPQIIRPNQQHPMVNQLADIEGLLNQTFVPRPLFEPAQAHFVDQPHLNAIALSMYRYYPYMRPEANHLNLRMPHFRSNQMFTLTSPSGQPRSFVSLHDQFNPRQRFVLSLDDALVYGPVLEMDHPQPQQQRQHLDFPIDMIHRQASPNAQQGQHFVYPLDMIHHQASSPNAAAPPPPFEGTFGHKTLQLNIYRGMKKVYRKVIWIRHSGFRVFRDKKWMFPFLASLVLSVTLLMSLMYAGFETSYVEEEPLLLPFDNLSEEYFVESHLRKSLNSNSSSNSSEVLPRLAYLISGTKGDSHRMMRTLQAVYHPRNQYVLHLDLEAPPKERLELAMSVKNDPTFLEVANVRVMSQSNLVTYKGPTMIACTLQAVAVLLKESLDWDWFINLSASDYPLVTQDDLLYVFSNLSRSVNFIEHMKLTGWKLNQRAKSIIVDPGLYLSKKTEIAWTTQHRSIPTSFKLFTGSAWVVLTRSFLEYSILGWDNFPRTILMYYANFVSSPEGYFHTVICNTKEFKSTAIGHDLHYISWDYPPKQHPNSLSMKDFDKMVKSKAPFARKFHKNDPVLDKIDKELLGRTHRFSSGAWCVGSSENGSDSCSVRGNDSVLRPGPGAERLKELVQTLLSDELRSKQCS
ncbi:hypothetical protein IGI04_011253 [Brassica rapa subsp. trilocularis]|uniref:Glycosyltransferase family 14 protein n=1 Tax=Brassica rapa subsp. trilocularis TaxID=1813537 RepID=A0ABQ7N5V1_BRACM|nr:hypothetical protein IGI04_011253 [Brassica rapa subsp. trilocularis]